jgi:hypothetical protein
MFIREWRGRAKQREAARYPDYFRKEVTRCATMSSSKPFIERHCGRSIAAMPS